MEDEPYRFIVRLSPIVDSRLTPSTKMLVFLIRKPSKTPLTLKCDS